MFNFLKKDKKQTEQISENPKPETPKEPKKSASEIYIERNPVSSDYKLTAGDLAAINDYLMYFRRIIGADSKVGYVEGYLLSLIIKVKVTLDRQKAEL